MSTKISAIAIIKAPFMFMFRLFLMLSLSKHAKRLFYFASLYANLLPADALKSEVMGRLNQAMNLATSDDALIFPATMSKIVWGNYKVADLMTPTMEDGAGGMNALDFKTTLVSSADALIDLTPRWMRFGSIDQMRRETVSFLQTVNDLRNAGVVPT